MLGYETVFHLVLPLDYHQNLSWKLDKSCLTVNAELLRRARIAAFTKLIMEIYHFIFR